MAERRVVLPPLAREIAVAQVCSLDIARTIERRWQSRSRGAMVPVLKSPDVAGSRFCPECNQPAPIAPVSSEYRGEGTIHHHWLCRACGHDWITVVDVPA
jgi:hypothetical protein